MAYIPINLDLQDKIVKVIGGGKIAERRVNALIDSEAVDSCYFTRTYRPFKAI
ncbi:hypothetical protein NIT60_06370 [Mammaliicoccus sciuri]|nr:hypothetical protein NIT60_06370 [Mammaliicoccus sciuri]